MMDSWRDPAIRLKTMSEKTGSTEERKCQIALNLEPTYLHGLVIKRLLPPRVSYNNYMTANRGCRVKSLK